MPGGFSLILPHTTNTATAAIITLKPMSFPSPLAIHDHCLLRSLSFGKVLDELHFWGLAHRKKVIGK